MPPDAQIEPRLMRMFAAIHATGSVTGAAERLGLSQPTVSIGLGQLRRHFGDALFVSTGTGMEPTALADQLIGPVEDALQALRRIAEWRMEFDPATEVRLFRICMTDASHITLMPRLYQEARRLAPGVTLMALPINRQTPQLLQSGDADLALGLIPDLGKGFFQQVLYQQDWVCLTRRDHPAGQLTRAAYEAADHVHVEAGTGQQLLLDALSGLRVTRKVTLTLPGFLGLSAVLGASDLIATLPRHTGQTLARQSSLLVHDCPFPIPGFSVTQLWHERFNKDPASIWLRRLCAALFAGA